MNREPMRRIEYGMIGTLTPEDNAQENNANRERQFIKPEVAVLTGRGRGRPPMGIRIVEQGTVSSAQASLRARQGCGRGRGVGRGGKLTEEQFRVMIAEDIVEVLQGFIPNIIAQTLEANRNAQLQREHEMTQKNTVSHNITRNIMNTKNTRNTSNDINSANSGSNKNTTNVVTIRNEVFENENNYVNRKRKGCTYMTFSACNPPDFNGKGDAGKFKEIVINKFCPEGELQQLEHEFLNLEQWDMSMREYMTRFNEKARFAKHHVQTKERRIRRYIWGMNSRIRELVKATRPKTYQEAVDASAKMEKEKLKHNVPMDSFKRKAGSTECYKCGKQGHISRECLNFRSCYECGERGHMRPDCPKLKKGTSGNLKLINGRSDKGGEIPKAKGRAYIMNTNDAMKTSYVVSDRAFIVETANGEEIKIFEIFEDCSINIDGNKFPARLMPMRLGGFDVVLGIDWLSYNNAEIMCNKKMVRILSPGGETIYVYGYQKENELGIISMMKANKYMKKGCVAYLAYIIDAQAEKQVVDVPIVREYLDVFSEDLPGIPPNRQVEFRIDLVPGAAPIAKTPYRLAPTEMQ
ncbi:putative reverse transcriptase domain-containing protein [Tanacetum coccineum]